METTARTEEMETSQPISTKDLRKLSQKVTFRFEDLLLDEQIRVRYERLLEEIDEESVKEIEDLASHCFMLGYCVKTFRDEEKINLRSVGC